MSSRESFHKFRNPRINPMKPDNTINKYISVPSLFNFRLKLLPKKIENEISEINNFMFNQEIKIFENFCVGNKTRLIWAQLNSTLSQHNRAAKRKFHKKPTKSQNLIERPSGNFLCKYIVRQSFFLVH